MAGARDHGSDVRVRIALVFAAPLAWVLGYLLRPARNQQIHVGVYFAVPTMVFWTLGGLLGLGWTVENLGFWATVGAAAALGRWAVRRQADLVPVPPGACCVPECRSCSWFRAPSGFGMCNAYDVGNDVRVPVAAL